LCIVLALLVSWPVRAAITTVTFPKAQAALESGRLAEAEERLDAIAAYAPRNYYRLYQYYGRLGVQKLLFGGQAMDRDEAMAVLRDAEEAFARAMRYNRDFTGIASDRGQLYFVAQGWLLPDGYARAEIDLLRVVEKNPLDWDARIGLVNVYQVQGYFSKALRVLERGRQWPMPRGQTGLSLMIMEAELHLKLGDRAGYQQGLAAARQFAVDNGLVAVPTTAGTSAPPAQD
jgi:tetratricopeptide (TPR) repeat protein